MKSKRVKYGENNLFSKCTTGLGYKLIAFFVALFLGFRCLLVAMIFFCHTDFNCVKSCSLYSGQTDMWEYVNDSTYNFIVEELIDGTQ